MQTKNKEQTLLRVDVPRGQKWTEKSSWAIPDNPKCLKLIKKEDKKTCDYVLQEQQHDRAHRYLSDIPVPRRPLVVVPVP